MSRIFLKELPNWTTKELLVSKFSSFGIITDVKLIKDFSGETKMFGYIGFYDRKSANKVLKNAKYIFLGNKKISVQQAFPKKIIAPFKNLKKETIKKSSEKRSIFKNIFETGILIVRNLSYKITKFEISQIFSPFGFVSNIFINKKNFKKIISLQIFVEFGLPECAIKAASFLDGKIFHGRILHILPFQGKNFHSKTQAAKEFLFFKFKKIKEELDRKNMINQRSWYTLFVSKEKLIKILFLKYGKSKNYEKFNFEFSKLSLTEARIQNEITLFLRYFGINMAVFNPNLIHKKSRRTLLLKNFTFEKKISSKKIFKKFGKITQFIILPLIKLILIEYQKKRDASQAFDYFEKIKFKKNNFFIEWAPLNSIENNIGLLNNKKEISNQTSFKENGIFFKKKKSFFLKSNKKNLENNLYQKNFLKKYQLPKKDFFENGPNLIDKLQMEKHKKLGKILIRNIPFEINLIGLKKIFQDFGTILSIRLPKKSPKQHKGFAFIEFKNLEEAKKVVLSTQNIHLFSRHLCVNLLTNF